MRRPVLSLAALLWALGGPAQAGTRISTQCQKSMDNGQVLAVDGRVLPAGARSRLVSYRAQFVRDGWSYGPCVYDVGR